MEKFNYSLNDLPMYKKDRIRYLCNKTAEFSEVLDPVLPIKKNSVCSELDLSQDNSKSLFIAPI
jgi:hypothetical protein